MAKRFRGSEGFQQDRRVRVDSPSRRSDKYPSDTKCPKCGLLFHEGVWKRASTAGKQEVRWKLCPACLQARNRRVGGTVMLAGSFIAQHREELLNRIRNVETNTSEERPLERVISIKENKDFIIISATTEHLVARIAKSIHRDFGGSLELRYAPEDKFATARWHRDA